MIARLHFSDETLGQLLNEEFDDGRAELTQHVETCEQCQARLETLTQDGLTWEEAGELLRDDLLDSTLRNPHESRVWTAFLKPSDHPDSLGRFGRYEIMEILGRGGMGIVMRGFDPALNRYSAVKVLSPELASSAAARQRFSREAKSAAAVVHPHVVPIQTVDEQDGLPYLVMPVVEGRSLQQRVDATGPLPIIEVVRIALQIAEGLAAAHAQGLVHRDIKPANILLENGVERVQITDFGLARAADDASMTRSGVIAGTPQYMSPEQARGDEIDCRSDLFSLGSVMFFMLTGRSPFRAENTMGVLHRITSQEPRRLRSINPDIPYWLQALVTRLLQKSPDKRFASAEATADALKHQLAELQDVSPCFGERLPASRFMSRGPLKWMVLSGGVMAALVYMAVIVLHTQDGTIHIQTKANLDREVPIVVKRGDDVVRRLTVDNDGVSTRVRAGTYTIEFEGEDTSFKLHGNQATVTVGNVWTAIIEYRQKVEDDDTWKSSRDPSAVRQLALSDVRNARYENALEKILWYWDNAVRLQPSQSAVRRSFLLADWLGLGEVYPPGLDKLRSIRDQLEVRVLADDQIRVRSEDFADIAAINHTLRQDQQTLRVFNEILKRDPQDAERLRPWLPASIEGIESQISDSAGDAESSRDDRQPLREIVSRVNDRLRTQYRDLEIQDLTEMELVTCAQWNLQTNDELDVKTRAALLSIAIERLLPKDWTLRCGVRDFPPAGKQIHGFVIELHHSSQPDVVTVRRRFLESNVQIEKPLPGTTPPGGTPLAAAITEFNSIHHRIDGNYQRPLTQEEVIAAIANWGSKRNEAPVDNATFEAFLDIAKTGVFPNGAEFELIPSFGTSQGSNFKIWSVRIKLPQIAKPGWTYAFGIREQFISVDSMDAATVYWGKPAENGLQVGVRLQPSQKHYKLGQKIDLEFFFRSITGQPISADLPNAFTYKKIHVVVGSQRNEVPTIERQVQMVGGWMRTRIGEQPTRMKGQAVQFIDSTRPDPIDDSNMLLVIEDALGALVPVEAGRTYRMQFTVDNFAKAGETLKTGEVEFSVINPSAATR